MAIKDFKVKNGIITGGSILPDSNEAYDLGSATKRWKDLYLSGSTLVLGDIRLKDSGGIPSFEALGGGKVKIDLSAMTTADLSEDNSAKYFTETRARSAFSIQNGSSGYDSATGVFTLPSTTDHVTEGSNLFYTQGRFDTAFAAKSTADLSEGSNLYYTDARADARAQIKIDALVNAAPSQLDTLDELAAALGDDSNFSGTVTASIATKLAIITDVAVTVAGGKFLLDGLSQATLHLQPGRTYRFDQSDSSNSNHPLRFSTTEDGTHTGGGAQYTTNVTTVNSAGSTGAYVEIVVNHATPALYYYCGNHSGMGAGSVAATAFDGAFSSLTGTPTTIAGYGITDAFDGAFGSLTGTPTTIAGYGITDAFDGAYGSLTGTPSTFAPAAHNQAWSTITSTPTTISGYGITDAFDGAFGSLSGTPTTISGYGITDAQATLVSGTNIKTINNNSLLGSGNITISGGSGGGTDSATVSAIILSDVDSAYVQARQSVGGAAIAVQDEGSNLSTAATTLNFVGSGVTASGTGSTKTITITGGGGGGGTVDSAQTISLAREAMSVTTGSASGGGSLTYNNATGVFTFAPADVGGGTVDSAQTISLISNTVDSAYIQARQVDLQRDSAFITGILDSAYINDRADISTVDASFIDFKFIADSGQTNISGLDANGNLLDFDSSNYQLYVNGIRLLKSDYTANPITNTITLGTAAIIQDEVVVNTVVSRDVATVVDADYINAKVRSSKALDGISTFSYTVDSGQTTFTGSDLSGNTLSYLQGDIQVYLNGILLADSDDYVASNGTSIVLTAAAPATSELVVQAFNLSEVSTYRSLPGLDVYNFTATLNQTTFQDSDVNGNVLSYHPGAILVSLNGIMLSSVDYTATDGSSIVLTDNAESASELTITSFAASAAIDSAFVQARQSSYGNADVLTFVDSAYVQLRSPQFDHLTVIDSSYVQARQISYGNADVLTFVDSAYVNARVSTVDSGQVLAIVNQSHVRSHADSDYIKTAANQTYIQGIVDQTYVRSHVDQTYIRSQQITGLDSALADGFLMTPAETLTLVDSSYVQARQAPGTDSGAVLGIVDSSYIQSVFSTSTGSATSTFRYTADSNQSVFTGADDVGNTLSYNTGQIQAFLNGIVIIDGVDYTATNGTSLTLTDPVVNGTELLITSHTNSYIKEFTNNNYFHNQSSFKNFIYTADSGQTVFSGSDSNGEVLNIDGNNYQVFVNGIRILASDFTANTTTNVITLHDQSEIGDEVSINTLQTNTSSVLQITGADSDYVTGIVNSVLSNDYVEVNSTPYTASIGKKLIVDTSSASITVNMPSSPTLGNEVRIIDGTGNAETNNIIVSSSDKILGSDSNLIIDINEAAFGLVYYNSTRGWILTEK